MLFNTIKTIVISLLLIALVHYLYTFFKDTLTVPKVKDLVNKPAKRYDEMYDSIRMQNSMVMQQQQSTPVQQSMQDELKNFLSELKKPNNANSNSNTNTNTNSNKNDNFPTANDMTVGYSPF